jgi:hypothetical protein
MYSIAIAAIGVALILTLFFSLLGMRGPWGSVWTFFLVLFLAIWTTGIYMTPIGPIFLNVAWVPIIFSGILFALLLIAVIPEVDNSKQLQREESGRVRENQELKNAGSPNAPIATMGIFFWLLITLLIVSITVGLVF